MKRGFLLLVCLCAALVMPVFGLPYNVLFETFKEKNGVMGHNVVATVNFEKPMQGRSVEVQGFLWNTKDNKRYYSGDNATLTVDGSNKIENLRFFVPHKNLPDGEYKAGAVVYDVTGGTRAQVMECVYKAGAYFHVKHADDKYLPYLAWDNLPETTNSNHLNGKITFANEANIPKFSTVQIIKDSRELGRIYSGGNSNSFDLSKIQLSNGLNQITAEGLFKIARVVNYTSQGATPSGKGNFNASDIRVMRVQLDGTDFIAVYFNPQVNNSMGKSVGFGAYLYTEKPSNSIKVSKFESFEVDRNPMSINNYCLMIPYSEVPAVYHSDQLRVLIAAYDGSSGGSNPWRQDGSWWGPSFNMAQLPVTQNPPLAGTVNDFSIRFISQKYQPAAGTAPPVLEITANVTVRNQAGKQCTLDATLYPVGSSDRLTYEGSQVSNHFPYTVTSDYDNRTVKITIPWYKIPQSMMQKPLHASLAAFVMVNGNWLQQKGSVWAPDFVPSQLTGGVTPPTPVAGSKPVLSWINLPATTTDKQLKIKVGVKSSSTITAHNVFVNGVVVRGVKPVKNDGYDMVLTETATLREGDNVIQVTVANSAGTTSEERHVTYSAKKVAPVGSKPTLTWISCPENPSTRTVNVKVGVKSTSTITSANLYVNGQQVRGVTPVKNDGYDMVLSQSVTLSDGVNIVKAVVTNSAGTVSEEREVTYGAQPIVNPNVSPVKKTENLKRIALVVGNSQYPGQELANTVNDASAMSAKLRSLGFDVIYVTEADRRTLDSKINEFGQQARNYDVALFYYAGHGIQYHGSNYLIPVDANLASESDIEYECTNVNRVLSKLEESGCKMKIIALDACRNNPFERSWHRAAGGGRGLSAINAPIGTFISYATSPGTTAADGETNHSPYTTALLNVLDEKDLPIETVFKRVASRVFELTNKTQTPWYSSSLFEGDFIFNPSK